MNQVLLATNYPPLSCIALWLGGLLLQLGAFVASVAALVLVWKPQARERALKLAKWTLGTLVIAALMELGGGCLDLQVRIKETAIVIGWLSSLPLLLAVSVLVLGS